jgi:hypothetical protein
MNTSDKIIELLGTLKEAQVYALTLRMDGEFMLPLYADMVLSETTTDIATIISNLENLKRETIDYPTLSVED